MRVIEISKGTPFGVNATIWLTKDVRFDLTRNTARLIFKGYLDANALLNGANPLDTVVIEVNDITDMPVNLDAGEHNAYELVFQQLLVKVLQTSDFAGGQVIDL
jgi:hypothetical protein